MLTNGISSCFLPWRVERTSPLRESEVVYKRMKAMTECIIRTNDKQELNLHYNTYHLVVF
jgi:hypothetical protein